MYRTFINECIAKCNISYCYTSFRKCDELRLHIFVSFSLPYILSCIFSLSFSSSSASVNFFSFLPFFQPLTLSFLYGCICFILYKYVIQHRQQKHTLLLFSCCSFNDTMSFTVFSASVSDHKSLIEPFSREKKK